MAEVIVLPDFEVSSTSHSISVGSKTFTIDTDDGLLKQGDSVRCIATTEPDAWLDGFISSKSGLSVVVAVWGVSSVTGTFDDWEIHLVNGPIVQLTEVGDEDYTILPSDRTVVLTTSLTTDRTWTLPLAASVPAGYALQLADFTGSPDFVTPSLSLIRAGSDTLNGATTGLSLGTPYFSTEIVSNGDDQWVLNLWQLGTLDRNLVINGNALFNGLTTLNDDVSVTSGANLDVTSGETTLGGRLHTEGGVTSTTLAGLSGLTKTTGTLVWCTDLGGGAGPLVYNGTAWTRIGDRHAADTTDANRTYNILSDGNIQRIGNILTANRARTLSDTDAYDGAQFHIINADAAQSVDVRDGSSVSIKVLGPLEWGRFVHTGSAWIQMSYGAM